MKKTTLCYPIINGNVLLAMKKRGFGIGKWNGPGGKAQENETPEQACRREFFEETGANIITLEHRGIVEFIFENKPEWNQECHVFIATELDGDPRETEEMLPRWFEVSKIPYPDMWEDDPIWLPAVLNGGRVEMRFYFDEHGKMLNHQSR